MLEALPQILAGVDQQVAQTVVRAFTKRGIKVRDRRRRSRASTATRDSRCASTAKNGDERLEVDAGRRERRSPARAREGIGLEGAGVEVDERGFVVVDGNLRTTSTACTRSATSSRRRSSRTSRSPRRSSRSRRSSARTRCPIDYDKVPWGIYCHPEVAFCGLTEEQAKERGLRRRDVGAPVGRQRPRADHRRDRRHGEDRRRARRPDPRRAHRRAVGDRADRRGRTSSVNWEATPADVGAADPRAPDAVASCSASRRSR